MKKKIYLRSTFKDIADSKGRFVAIILIIFLGVMLFSGIKSVGPDLDKTGNKLVEEMSLSDLQVVSTGGLTEKDRQLVLDHGAESAELGYSFPYLNEEDNEVLQIYSYDKDAGQNKLELVSGSLPDEKSEIFLDALAKEKGAKLGDTVEIDEPDQLSQKEYKVAGFVKSPVYIDNLLRGSANVGHGQVDYFAFIPEENFTSDVHSIMYVSFKNTAKLSAFSDAYKDKMEDNIDELEDAFQPRREERKQELQDTANEELQDEKDKLTDGKTQLSDGKKQLTDAQAQLDEQKAQLDSNESQLSAMMGAQGASQQLADARTQLSDAQKELDTKKKEVADKEAELADGEAEIKEAEQDIADLDTPNYFLNDRTSNPGFADYQSLSDRIDMIANIFPVFFFFIAILITFTTMTRMVEENRGDIGTLKALGYRKREIASKYILYAVLATVIGVILGVVVGTNFLPAVVFQVFNGQYIFPEMIIRYYSLPIVLSAAASLFATLGASLIVLLKELMEKPATLLRPKSPKSGKRILLEYITPLWSRLNFNQKVSYRNLFRFKSRAILTIVGIAGCSGLMLSGYGLRDSIGAPVTKQFSEITHYQTVISLNGDEEADKKEVGDALADDTKVKDELPAYSDQLTFRKAGKSKQRASLYVPEKAENLASFVSLIDNETKKEFDLPDEGIVITQRLAEELDIKVGDKVSFKDNEGHSLEAKVARIALNYTGHSVYASPACYEKILGETLVSNTFLVKTEKLSEKNQDAFSKKMNGTDKVASTVFLAEEAKRQQISANNLDPVVVIFIVMSGTLAFVVLYNLTNINVSERIRELSTIKVLGFYDNEVTMYIVRESVMLTLFGILFGFAVGNLLTKLILVMAAMETIYFPLIIYWQGYVVSAAMTLVFSVVVSIFTHFKLRRIDMIEALKSNE